MRIYWGRLALYATAAVVISPAIIFVLRAWLAAFKWAWGIL